MKTNKCQVFILFGQSQATGHAIPMSESDKITTPLKNVFGLNRKDNQSFDIQSLTWSGYTSAHMNLGEEQDNTYSLANCLATRWQQAIDSGVDLPDLYIVHISIGAQGVTEQYLPNGEVKKYMWNPLYEKKLIPGRLWTADISLYPFALHILSLLDESFKRHGKDYAVMNLYWRGGEEDMTTPVAVLREKLKGVYEEIFAGFYSALGLKPPVTLNRIVSREATLKHWGDAGIQSLDYIEQVFESLSQENENISLFDCRNSPYYTATESGNGLFIEDLVHYKPEINWWNAEVIVKNQIARLCENPTEIF